MTLSLFEILSIIGFMLGIGATIYGLLERRFQRQDEKLEKILDAVTRVDKEAVTHENCRRRQEKCLATIIAQTRRISP